MHCTLAEQADCAGPPVPDEPTLQFPNTASSGRSFTSQILGLMKTFLDVFCDRTSFFFIALLFRLPTFGKACRMPNSPDPIQCQPFDGATTSNTKSAMSYLRLSL